MIAKVFYLFLIQINYHFSTAIEKRFCDKTYKDSLLGLGGIFSIDDLIFATRRYPNSDQMIVWKFKLKVIGTETKFKDNKIEITDMSSYEMKSLFPDLTFEHFVSGFAITDTNPCNDSTEECANTSHMKNLTVILGPKKSDSRQPYAVYRYNGIGFTSVDSKSDVLPLGLKRRGTTTHWFSPKTFITTTFRHNKKEIIGFNYGDRSINKLELKKFTKQRIGNRLWNILVSDFKVQTFYYHLIEIKVTESQRKVLLITQQMVYQLTDDNKLQELMHPWDLFGCKSIQVSLRSGEMAPKKFVVKKSPIVLDNYEDLGFKLIVELLVLNVIYITLILIAFAFI